MLASEYGDEQASSIQELYCRCRSIPLSYSDVDITYNQLRPKLRMIAKERYSAFVDVTSICKKYIGDVLSAGLVEGLQQVCTFDILLSDPNYDEPWTLLIHNFFDSEDKLYSYPNILDTFIYRECSGASHLALSRKT